MISLYKTVSFELDKLTVSFAVNNLSLIIAKTNFMIFSKRSTPESLQISINYIKLERVFATIFLGILIDSDLKWKARVSAVHKEICKNLAIMTNSRNKLSSDTTTFILLVRNMGLLQQVSFILKLQKINAVRAISGLPYYSHTSHMLKNLKF